jgi:hypothetical protein
MTQLCAECGQILGEKCGRCGAKAEPVSVNALGHAIVGTDFLCPQCGFRFPQGESGETHTLCESCVVLVRKAGAGR